MPIIQPSRMPNGEAPPVENRGMAAAQTFTKGAPLSIAAGVVSLHAGGATVTGLHGFALEGATASVSDGANSTQVALSRADGTVEFVGQLINATVIQTPNLANVNVEYGIIIDGTDWYVDEADITDVVVKITDFDAALQLVWFVVLPSAGPNPN